MLAFVMSVTTSYAQSGSVGANRNSSGKSLYVSSYKGDDSKDGLTLDNAIKTLDLAISKAKQDQNITTIYICGTYAIEGKLSLDGTKAVIKRHPNFGGSLFLVNEGKEATFENVTVDGNSENTAVTSSSLIEVERKATLNIKDGAILQNNHIGPTGFDAQNFRGGAVRSTGIINMTGGIIQNNEANLGGAICIYTPDEPKDYVKNNGTLTYSVMNFSGGVIRNNKAKDYTSISSGTSFTSGGGISMLGGTELNMSGTAEVSSNFSENEGGGISLGDLRGDLFDITLNMTGGIVTKNSSKGCGGGIIVQASQDLTNEIGEAYPNIRVKFYNTANISGGEITYNKMLGGANGANTWFGGGGIYVNGAQAPAPPDYYEFINGTLNLKNAIIKENKAAHYGGGLAACPSSHVRVALNDGAAMFNNHTSTNKAREIYLVGGMIGGHVGTCPYAISALMLGGKPYNWKWHDGSDLDINILSGELGTNEAILIHTDVKESPEAEKVAKVLIAYNESSTSGGGIGSNGDVYIGKDAMTEVKVSKTWVDKDATKRPKEVKLGLYRELAGNKNDKVLVDYQTMTADNWSAVFQHLPKLDNNGNEIIYTIKEEAVAGYESEIKAIGKNEFKLTNTKTIPKINIEVEKIWQGGPEKKPTIHINLLRNGEVIETIAIKNGENSYTFENMDEFDDNGNKYEYTVEEKKLEGYTSKVEGYKITNIYNPPVNTVPKTGDNSQTALYTVLLFGSLALSTIVAIRLKKKEN